MLSVNDIEKVLLKQKQAEAAEKRRAEVQKYSLSFSGRTAPPCCMLTLGGAWMRC